METSKKTKNTRTLQTGLKYTLLYGNQDIIPAKNSICERFKIYIIVWKRTMRKVGEARNFLV